MSNHESSAVALSAIETLDTIAIVGDEKREPRGRTVPIAAWWGALAKRKIKEHPTLDQKTLAAKLEIDEAQLTRALHDPSHKDWKPVLEIVMAVSDELGIPYPMRIAETEEIALGLAEHHRLLRRDAQLKEIRPGVPKKTQESQTIEVQSKNGSGPRKPSRKKAPTGPRAR